MKTFPRIVFIGWNENGEKCLTSLLQIEANIVQVIVPFGYDTKPMARIAKKAGLPYRETNNKGEEILSFVEQLKPDLIIIASFPKLILPQVIDFPPLGAINVHTAELPKYRGFHPLNWALIKDEKKVGVTVHYIDRGMDTGDILAQGTIPVTNYDDINSIKDKLTTMGADLLKDVVKEIMKTGKKLSGTSQRDSEAMYAPMRKPEDGKIKWVHNTRDIFNLVRSLKKPYPNAFSMNKKGEKIEFEESYLSKNPGEVLAIVKDHYLVATGDGVILLKSNKSLKIGEVLQ